MKTLYLIPTVLAAAIAASTVNAQADRDGDGRLSIDEARQALPANVTVTDSNNDGILSRGEAQRAIQGLTFSGDGAEGDPVQAEEYQQIVEAVKQQDGDQRENRQLGATGAGATATDRAAPASRDRDVPGLAQANDGLQERESSRNTQDTAAGGQQTARDNSQARGEQNRPSASLSQNSSRDGSEQQLPEFDQVDSDGNGTLSTEEARQVLPSHIVVVDANNDGILNRDEAQRAIPELSFADESSSEDNAINQSDYEMIRQSINMRSRGNVLEGLEGLEDDAADGNQGSRDAAPGAADRG